MLWACIGGAASFGVSSCLSSFSFRAVQNGIAFFLLLAIAVHELNKRSSEMTTKRGTLPHFNIRWAVPLVSAILLIQTCFFSAKGVAEYIAITAGMTADHDEANTMYDLALQMDPDYSSLLLLGAMRSIESNDFQAAETKMRRAVDNGMGVPTTYSTLAKFQYENGEAEKAESSLAEALTIFPRSVFLRSRLAILLEDSGKIDEADIQLRAADSVDPRQAAGWHKLLKKGGLTAYLEARNGQDAAIPSELVPASIVREFLNSPAEVSRR
jgi:tetratricopeptide (TPR) repeat protein